MKILNNYLDYLNSDNIQTEIIKNIGIAGLAAATGAFKILKYSIQITKNNISKASRECKQFDGQEFKDCKKRYRKLAYKQQLNFLKSSKIECKKTKEPEKCEYIISKQINKYEKRLRNL